MGDLRETTQEMERREQELRDKQEQLVQAGKLATLGELTTGVAHELNNPLNNIGLFVGNVIDRVHLGALDSERSLADLEKAMEQVRKATEIISHLRTFGRAAPVTVEQVDVDEVIERALSLMHEQLRLRAIEVELDLSGPELIVLGNPIQLEQVFINLLTNARDALADATTRTIRIASKLRTATGSRSSSRTPARGSPSTSSSASSIRSSRRRRSARAPASGSRSPTASSRSTAARSILVPGPARAQRSRIELPVGRREPGRGAAAVNEARILIVDDDPALLEALPAGAPAAAGRDRDRHLRDRGRRARAHPRGGLRRDRDRHQDARHGRAGAPAGDQEARPGTPTLLITGHGEHDLAVQALRGGAYDFVAKPIDRDYFVASLERAIQLRRLDRQVESQRLALERHALVLEHVDDGVFLVDEDGLIQHWNPAAQSITGLAPEDVLGRIADDALPGWQALGPTVPVASVPGPGSTEAKTFPLEIDGRELWLSISGVKFADGVVYAFRNLTEERALEELKGEFVATVSHELRTPLAAIYGSAKTLLRRDVELDELSKDRLLKVIASESERLTRIASDILLANNLDSGRLLLDREQVDVAQLAREVVEEMRELFADREGLSFELDDPDSPAPFQGDGDKLRQVLLNLLDNAVKYSPAGGRVVLGVETHEDALRLVVKDEGLGIAAGEQPRIFGKFYRVDPQQSRGVGGTGLGLYICRELVRNMEGRISVTSREGKGSTFVVELPRATVTRVPRARCRVRPPGLISAERSSSKTSSSPSSSSIASPVWVKPSPRMIASEGSLPGELQATKCRIPRSSARRISSVAAAVA